MAIAALDYIDVDDRGVARIAGSRSKVSLIVRDVRGGMSPEDIAAGYSHLSLPQVYAALAYYHAHKAEVDAQMEASDRYVEEMMAKQPPGLTREETLARHPPEVRERLLREYAQLDAEEDAKP